MTRTGPIVEHKELFGKQFIFRGLKCEITHTYNYCFEYIIIHENYRDSAINGKNLITYEYWNKYYNIKANTLVYHEELQHY